MSDAVNLSPYPMNRVQRRAHYREAKRDPIAVYCPRCTHKTRHISVPMDTNWAKSHRVFDDPMKKKSVKCNVVCVACGNVLRTDMDLIPYEYVKRVD